MNFSKLLGIGAAALAVPALLGAGPLAGLFGTGGPAAAAGGLGKAAGAAAGSGGAAGWGNLLKTAAVNAGTNAAVQSAMPQYGTTTPMSTPPLTQLPDPMQQLQALMSRKKGVMS